MSIQSQIDRLNNAKANIISAISSKGVSVANGASIDDLPALVESIETSGGTGSGIIDVTELPTSGIDENAVYRVTESYKSSGLDVVILAPDEESGKLALVPLSYFLDGEIEIHEIDSLEEAVPIYASGASWVWPINVLRTDGTTYLFSPEMIGDTPLPMDIVIIGETGYDKGYTDDINLETEMGIYVTREQYDTFQKWFIRESGEWKEITAQIRGVLYNGGIDIEVLSGTYEKGEEIEVVDNRCEIDVVDTIVKDKVIPSKIIVNTPFLSKFAEIYTSSVPKSWFLTSDGDYIDYVRDGLFMNLTNLRYVEFPENLGEIGDRAFEGCQRLALTSLPEYVSVIGKWAFSGCYSLNLTSLPEWIDTIQQSSFSVCRSLALTSLPERVVEIGYQAFYGCYSLALTSLPEGLMTIDDSAFYNCQNLALTSLPQSLKNVGSDAFGNCVGLKTITFKGKPDYLPYDIFFNCTNLKTINVPWSEGEMSNAPWGATNATINYNYTGG